MTRQDLLTSDVDVPLTVVVVVMGGKELDDRDLKLLPNATPKSFMEAIYPQEVRAGMRVPKHPYASIVHDEYVQDVSVKVNGRTATGGVRFRAPGAYEGFLSFTAFRDASGWRILELVFPHSKVRTVLESGRWRLRLPETRPPAKPLRDKQIDLPRVGTAGSVPSSSVSTRMRRRTTSSWPSGAHRPRGGVTRLPYGYSPPTSAARSSRRVCNARERRHATSRQPCSPRGPGASYSTTTRPYPRRST